MFKNYRLKETLRYIKELKALFNDNNIIKNEWNGIPNHIVLSSLSDNINNKIRKNCIFNFGSLCRIDEFNIIRDKHVMIVDVKKWIDFCNRYCFLLDYKCLVNEDTIKVGDVILIDKFYAESYSKIGNRQYNDFDWIKNIFNSNHYIEIYDTIYNKIYATSFFDIIKYKLKLFYLTKFK